jgi:hypothetical protein
MCLATGAGASQVAQGSTADRPAAELVYNVTASADGIYRYDFNLRTHGGSYD